jgi:hypothetical protein
VNHARWDLCGGCSAMGIPTAIERPFLGDGTGGRASGEDILAVEHERYPAGIGLTRSSRERSIPFATESH